MKLLSSSLIGAVLALVSPVLFAQAQTPAVIGELDEDQMRGIVVDVNPSQNTVTVWPKETGSKVEVQNGGAVVLEVSEDTYVQDSIASTIVDRLNTLQEGDQVRVEFDLPKDPQAVHRLDTINGDITPPEERADIREPAS